MNIEEPQLRTQNPGPEALIHRSRKSMVHQGNHVAIVLVNWNNSQDTIACIKTLRTLNYQDSQIVVVENNSRRDEYSLLRSQCKKEIILSEKRNRLALEQ